ncbi:hypothetical protein DWUX_1962 [Desulfovibrio diazotrophicus]|nr:hypothetical protein DWUX_1962 [Desulfovibrio diazotrophicus]
MGCQDGFGQAGYRKAARKCGRNFTFRQGMDCPQRVWTKERCPRFDAA